MIRFLVTDLDGTLLRSDKSISDYSISILQQCRENGILTAFATARSLPSAAPYLSRFMPDAFIGYGGAFTMVKGKLTEQFALPFETVERFLKCCAIDPRIAVIHVNRQDITLTNLKTEAAKDPAHYCYTDFAHIPPDHYLKMSVRCSEPNAIAQIAKKFPECRLQVYSGEDFYTFYYIGATKWNALKKVAASYSVCFSEIAAFGDDQNDLEMIQNCGYGVATENAIPEVKRMARFSCPSNDNDGVAKWIEKFLLIQK